MATTYSTSLNLAYIGTGDQSGTWGATTNTNLGLIEQAITGVTSISLSGTSYTLVPLNGVSDVPRNMVLVFGGTPSGNVTVTAPLVQKFYVITNNTAYNIIMAATGGSISLTIPSGITAQCYCDGSTGFYSAQTGSAGNFLVNGNLSVTGNTADVGNLSVTGTASLNGTSTAVTPTLGDNSTKIATTAFVATTTGALGTMSTQNANNVAIIGGSINGTTIGASTAAAGTFTTVVAATQFTGPGTGLTGTASSLTAGNINSASNTTLTSLANLATVGTITSGTWQGSVIQPAYIATLNQNTTGTAANITATSNSTLTTLSALSLPYSQLSGTVPTWNQNTTGTAANITASSNTSLTSLSNLSTVGTIGTGVWQGSAIQPSYIATLNQNTTGTAGGLTGTPNISVGTVSATGVITSTVATGTAPFTVASTTQVGNLYATYAGLSNSVGGVNATAVATAILQAAVNANPGKTLFKDTTISGRPLGDINNDGNVTTVDASLYNQWGGGVLTDPTQIAYITNVLNPYMLANASTYAAYLTGGTVNALTGTFSGQITSTVATGTAP